MSIKTPCLISLNCIPPKITVLPLLERTLYGCITPMAKIVTNFEGLPPDKLNLAEKFLETFSVGARNK